MPQPGGRRHATRVTGKPKSWTLFFGVLTATSICFAAPTLLIGQETGKAAGSSGKSSDSKTAPPSGQVSGSKADSKTTKEGNSAKPATNPVPQKKVVRPAANNPLQVQPQPNVPQFQLQVFGGRGQVQVRVFGGPGGAVQQINPTGKTTQPTTLVTDQDIRRRIDKAKGLIGEKQVPAAIVILQSVLNDAEDTFVPEKEDWRISRRAVEAIIANSSELLAEYRLQHEDQASDLLRQATNAQDSRVWAEVSRKFFLTKAGFHALNLLATYQLDRGNAGLALLYLNRIVESKVHRDLVNHSHRVKQAVALSLLGRRVDAEKLLASLNFSTLNLGGAQRRATDLLDAAGTADSFQQKAPKDWLMASGSLSRTPIGHGSAPFLSADWRRPLTESSRLLAQLNEFTETDETGRRPTIFSIQPVIVDGVVYVRDFDGVGAYDFATGEKKWRKTEGALSGSLNYSTTNYNRYATGIPLQPYASTVTNSLYGEMSSDGDRLYYVDEISLDSNIYRRFNGRNQNLNQGRGRNRLGAYDLKTGNPIWQIGGKPAVNKADDKSVTTDIKTFYLGPPLPIDGKLYVLAESKSEIRLFCLAPESGATLWSQALVGCQRSIEVDYFRACQSCRLAYYGGILICPTNLMRTLAIDLTTRSILWEYNHPEDGAYTGPSYDAFGAFTASISYGVCDPPCIAGDRVVFISAEGGSAHCVNLLTGERHWKVAMPKDGQLVGIQNELVLFVGSESTRAVRLSDGVPLWSTVTPVPSGRGIFVGSNFFLPTAEGRVLVIDPSNGKIESQIRQRNDEPVGSLVALKDRVLAVGISGIKSFPTLDGFRAQTNSELARSPKSPIGLTHRAQLALSNGDVNAAVQDLRSALQNSPDEKQKTAASETLFDIASKELLEKPGDATAVLTDLLKLAESNPQKAVYLRLLAEERLANGDAIGAWDAVEKCQRLGLSGSELIDRGMKTQSAATWARSVFRRANDLAATDPKNEFQKKMQQRLDECVKKKDLEGLRGLSRLWIGTRIGSTADRSLADALIEKNLHGEADLILTSLSNSNMPEVAGPALVKLAEMSQKANESADTLYYLRNLSDRFPKFKVKPDLTASEYLANTQKKIEPELLKRQKEVEWKYDSISAKIARRGPYSSSRMSKPFYFGAESELPFFQSNLVQYDQVNSFGNQLSLVERSTGAKAWSMPINFAQRNPYAARSTSTGRELLILMGNELQLISTRGQSLQWKRNLEVSTSTNSAYDESFDAYSGNINPQAMIVAMKDKTVALRTGKQLKVLDITNGKDLWSIPRIRSTQRIFGDGEYLIVLESDRTYVAYRMADGQKIVSGKLQTTWNGDSFTSGRNILVASGQFTRRSLDYGGFNVSRGMDTALSANSKDVTLGLWDPVEKKFVWKKEVAEHSLVFSELRSPIFVTMDLNGKCAAIDKNTGKILLNDKLDLSAIPTVNWISVFSDTQRYYLSIERSRIQTYLSSLGLDWRPINGLLRAYDRESRKFVWEQTLEKRLILTSPGETLPVFFIQSHPYETGFDKNQFTCEVLDKRDGKIVSKNSTLEYPQNYMELAYSPKERWIELRTYNSQVRVDMTSEGKK